MDIDVGLAVPRAVRLNERLTEVMDLSAELARTHGQQVTTLHVLKALIEKDERLLSFMGIDQEHLSAEVGCTLGQVPRGSDSTIYALSPAVEQAIEITRSEARSHELTVATTGHLFLGLLQCGDNLLPEKIKNSPIDILRARLHRFFLGDVAVAPGTMPSSTLRERCTDRLRLAWSSAVTEAKRREQRWIRTSHMAYGLTKMQPGVGITALQEMGISVAEWEGHAVSLLVRDDGESSTELGLKRVLMAACSEAVELVHNYIGTEHFILGCFREQDRSSSNSMVFFKRPLEDARSMVRHVLGEIDPEPQEIEEVRAKLQGVRTIDDIRARLGAPDHTGAQFPPNGKQSIVYETLMGTVRIHAYEYEDGGLSVCCGGRRNFTG